MSDFCSKCKALAPFFFKRLYSLLIIGLVVSYLILCHSGMEAFFETQINALLFGFGALVAVNIPIISFGIPSFATYAAYLIKDDSPYSMAMFVVICIIDIPALLALIVISVQLFLKVFRRFKER